MLSSLCSTSLHFPPHRINSHSPISSSHPTTHLLQSFSSPLELKQVHAHLVKTSTSLSSTSLSSLPLSRVAFICALSPNFCYARKIFEHIKDLPEIVLWNSCLKIFAEGDNPYRSISLFYQLRQYDVFPDSFTFSFLLKACTRLSDISNGRIVHGYIEKLGLQSNVFLQNPIVHLYALGGSVGDARLLFETMSHRDIVTWNIMITQLVKKGDIEGAYDLFLKMPERNVRSWTLMIQGFVQYGKPKKAIDCFLEMEKGGVKPNEVTLVAVLAACADMGDLHLGRRVHDHSLHFGFESNSHISNTLIDMYVKCGCLEDAQGVFDKMAERTVVSWSAMISGLAMHGKAEEALQLFSMMIEIGMNPNGVTFIGLLHACSHMGLIVKGRKLFASMIEDYGIIPTIEHYGCMVDLFSRAGLLQEAHEFIINMPIKPNGVIWGALLGGCKVYKNIELAEEAITHLSKLDPLNDGYYVVLSNTYAEAGQWKETARVRKLMKDRGVKKTPGWSSISVDGVNHVFTAGDDNHPQAAEISQKWGELVSRMKMMGYVPKTSVVLLDIEESEKEKFLYRHSEKLALVFGLMKTPPGSPIRIMKNLRVCEDCHASLKLISLITNREIVVRDRNRFHCFKDGSCSCRDYW